MKKEEEAKRSPEEEEILVAGTYWQIEIIQKPPRISFSMRWWKCFRNP